MLVLLTLASALACVTLSRICWVTWQRTGNKIVQSLGMGFAVLAAIYGGTGTVELFGGGFDDPGPWTYYRPFAVRGGPALVFWYLVWRLRR